MHLPRKLLLAGAVGGTIGLALAGCTAGEGTDTDVESGTAVELIDSMPAATGEIDSFTWNLPGGEPYSIDPSQTGVSNQTVFSNLCENLLLLNPDYSVSPNLAEVEQTDDVTYLVKIRDDVTFWDGSPVTADDAIFSLERQLDPELGSQNAELLKAVASIEKIDDSSFTITLSSPDAGFYGLLATPVGNVVQKAYTESAGEAFGTVNGDVMCTGPFTLSEWKSGESITLVRNDDYWDAGRAAKAGSVRMFFNTDTASATAALQSGEIDGVFEFPLSAVTQLLATDGTTSFGPSPRHYTLNFVNVADGPVADVRVRKALALAIDYQGIIDGALLGYADTKKALVPNVSFTMESQAAYDEYLKNSPNGTQDLDAAKKLIEEVGAPSEQIVFAYPTNLPEHAQIAAAVQSAGTAIGLDIKLEPRDLPNLIPAIIGSTEDARDGMDIIMWNGILDVPPEPTTWYRKYIGGASFDFSGIQTPEYDALVTEAISTLDPAERADLILQAQAIMDEEVTTIPLTSNLSKTWIAKGLTGVPTSGMYNNVPWAATVGSDG